MTHTKRNGIRACFWERYGTFVIIAQLFYHHNCLCNIDSTFQNSFENILLGLLKELEVSNPESLASQIGPNNSIEQVLGPKR